MTSARGAKLTDRKRPAPPAWAQWIRSRIGTRPRQRLTWLLDQVVYGPPAEGLDDGRAILLWWELLVLIQDATDSEWRPDALKSEVLRTYTSDDENMAPWQKLADPQLRRLLRASRGRRVPQAIEMKDGTLYTPPALQGPATTVRDGTSAPDARRVIARAQNRLRRYLSGRRVRIGPATILPLQSGQTRRRPHFIAPLAVALIVATEALRLALPRESLRRCPFELPGSVRTCGKLFVPRTRDARCREHQRNARRAQLRRAQRELRRRRA
jgi:hypothetical protein